MTQAQFVRLKRTPEGLPNAEDFELADMPAPEPGPGEALIAVKWLSLDPYMRGQMSGRHLSGAVKPGEMLRGESVGQIAASRTPALPEGAWVSAFTGWTSHGLATPESARILNFGGLPERYALGVLGMPGLTAYAGLLRLGEPKPGDTVLVSSAAGVVGATAGQIARLMGAQAVGVAGGPEKCAWTAGPARFKDCIDYKAEDLRARLSAMGGVDVYFDNIGGDMLQAAMENLKLGARVILCGLMAQYNEAGLPPGPNPAFIIKARATVRGMVVYDHEDLRAEMTERVSDWLRAGELVVKEEISHGLASAGEAFAQLMRGQGWGKRLVAV